MSSGIQYNLELILEGMSFTAGVRSVAGLLAAMASHMGLGYAVNMLRCTYKRVS